MTRKRKKVPKTGAVWRMSAEEATLAKMPRYDAWACGHGPHGSAGYRRAKEKRAWDKQMQQEGVRKGSFLFHPPRLSSAPKSDAAPEDAAAAKPTRSGAPLQGTMPRAV